jgi:hypothetical protein
MDLNYVPHVDTKHLRRRTKVGATGSGGERGLIGAKVCDPKPLKLIISYQIYWGLVNMLDADISFFRCMTLYWLKKV